MTAPRKLAAGLASLALAGFVATGAAAAELRVVTLPDYTPFSGPDLPNKGLCNDAAKTVWENAGHTVTVELMPWNRAKKQVQAGEADVLTCAWYTDERNEYLNFPEPFAENRMVFMKPAGSDFTFSDLDDLAGMAVGTVQGYGYNDAFQKADHFTKQAAGSLVNNIRKLMRERIDLAVGDELVMKSIVSKQMPDKADQVTYTDGAMSVKPLYAGVARANPNHESLVAEFNETLAAMKEDGRWQDVLARQGMTD